MTVEQHSFPQHAGQQRSHEKRYAQITEVTGVKDASLIEEAIQACCNDKGQYEIDDVIAFLLNVEQQQQQQQQQQSQKKKPTKESASQARRDHVDAVSERVPKTKGVIDLTGAGENEDMQRAIAASLQESQGILGGQVTREEQDISRVLEQSLQESKPGMKRKRGVDLCFFDPLNPHERKRQGGMPVGIKNIGNTCWFSSVIQSLFHIHKFRQFVLHFQPPDTNVAVAPMSQRNLRFMSELRTLFGLLVGSERKYVDPSRAVDIFKEAFCVSTSTADSQQQDVSEFQHKLLEWLEDAFKLGMTLSQGPTARSGGTGSGEGQSCGNPVIDLFYGDFKAEGVHEGNVFENIETFGQFPLQVNGFKDIHESLEATTAPGEIEGVDKEVTQKSGQELWFTRLPPVLTFEFSRFQFNQQLARPEKIHNKIAFPEVLFMDRYLERNKAETRMRRDEARKLKEELAFLQARLDKFQCYGSGSKRFPLQDVLQSALDFAQTPPQPSCPIADVEMESPRPPSGATASPVGSPMVPLSSPGADATMASPPPLHRSPSRRDRQVANPAPREVSESELSVLQDCLARWRSEVQSDVRELQRNIALLEEKLSMMYSDSAMQQCAYHLHAVLVHEGQAASGHYWAYVYDLQRRLWLKFNDTTVSESSWEELQKDSIGGYHNASAYCLMYINCQQIEVPSEGEAKRQASLESLPDDLRSFVLEDNARLAQEIAEWDREQARRAVMGSTGDSAGGASGPAGEGSIAVQEARSGSHSMATQTGMHAPAPPRGSPECHAALSQQATLHALQPYANMEPRDAILKAVHAEFDRLKPLAAKCAELGCADDPRLQHCAAYMIANKAEPALLQNVLFEQIHFLANPSNDARLAQLKQVAGELRNVHSAAGDNSLHLQEWHNRFNDFRETAYMFVCGVDAFFKERREVALSFLNQAWWRNQQLFQGLPPHSRLPPPILAYFRRECALQLSELATQHFVNEEDLGEVISTVTTQLLPTHHMLAQSHLEQDTAAAEAIGEQWCALLGLELGEVKKEKLSDIISRLYDNDPVPQPTFTPVRPSDMAQLHQQYLEVMRLAAQRGHIHEALQ